MPEIDRIDAEIEAAEQSVREIEIEGKSNILKHFDRLHDKLFDLNNILIAAFLAFTQIGGKVPVTAVLFPIANLVILIWVEYSNMSRARLEANIRNIEMTRGIKRHRRMVQQTNLFSLLTIFSTLAVLFVLLIYLFW